MNPYSIHSSDNFTSIQNILLIFLSVNFVINFLYLQSYQVALYLRKNSVYRVFQKLGSVMAL